MPFDGQSYRQRPPFVPGREGLRVLARELRKPMPEGFKWYFGLPWYQDGCRTVGCAMGLAKTLWPDSVWVPVSSVMAKVFDIPQAAATDLFMSPDVPMTTWCDITPAEVADAIDRYLDTGIVTYAPDQP